MAEEDSMNEVKEEVKEEVADIAPFDPTKKKTAKKVVIQDPADESVDELAEKTESLSDDMDPRDLAREAKALRNAAPPRATEALAGSPGDKRKEPPADFRRLKRAREGHEEPSRVEKERRTRRSLSPVRIAQPHRRPGIAAEAMVHGPGKGKDIWVPSWGIGSKSTLGSKADAIQAIQCGLRFPADQSMANPRTASESLDNACQHIALMILDVHNLTDKVNQMTDKVDQLAQENSRLKETKQKYSQENRNLQEEISRVKEEKKKLEHDLTSTRNSLHEATRKADEQMTLAVSQAKKKAVEDFLKSDEFKKILLKEAAPGYLMGFDACKAQCLEIEPSLDVSRLDLGSDHCLGYETREPLGTLITEGGDIGREGGGDEIAQVVQSVVVPSSPILP